MRPAALMLAGGAALLLAGCHDNLSAAASADANTCYALPTGAAAKKVAIGADDENLETCAMHLEGWRLEHRLPASTGFYEAHYIYSSPAGITAAASDTGIRYSIYTKAEQADLDNKLQTLIAEARARGGGGQNTTAPANAAGD